MAGFRFVIASTATVQSIMQHNDKELNQKLQEKTKQFVNEQVQEKRKSTKVIIESSDSRNDKKWPT